MRLALGKASSRLPYSIVDGNTKCFRKTASVSQILAIGSLNTLNNVNTIHETLLLLRTRFHALH